MSKHHTSDGSPYAPHHPEDTTAMLEAIGVDDIEELFTVPDELLYEDSLGIDEHTERETIAYIEDRLEQNDDVVEFLGRGHYDHYVPSMVDHISSRSEFLTSYTQYQAETSQGFLQALFEYQSILSELTGLEIVNCSIYDAATALGEAARLSARARRVNGDRILIPEHIDSRHRSVLDNYVDGTSLVVDEYPYVDGNTDTDQLAEIADDDVGMVYATSPTIRGTLESQLEAVGDIAADNDALFCLGTDPVALSVIEEPASLGADIVIGDASVLGLRSSYGTGLGLFSADERFLRQMPGRLAGVSEDADDNRAYSLVLSTREQHIRRERATSNICTNAAWLALRTAMHAAMLGPRGLVELAETCVTEPAQLAKRLDQIDGITAPVHDRHHFREFVVGTDQPAELVQDKLYERGFAVHAIDDNKLQICVTDTNAEHTTELATALSDIMAREEVKQ